MNKRAYLIVLPLLVLAIGLLAGCIRGVTGDSLAPVDEQIPESDSHVTVDPRVVEALKTDESIEVLISLKNPDDPREEWTDTLRWENAARRQDAVLAALTEEDFTLIGRFETAAAMSGYITASGVEKLRNHPDVTGIGAALLGSFEGSNVEMPLDD